MKIETEITKEQKKILDAILEEYTDVVDILEEILACDIFSNTKIEINLNNNKIKITNEKIRTIKEN